ncbi:uncharacterized protein, partial [Hemitrygon akajei]|uniref:uncharacterized protein n=1 Tax=Hemitrygon akajei TaxID=2704970 RepID=UPI003BF9844B
MLSTWTLVKPLTLQLIWKARSRGILGKHVKWIHFGLDDKKQREMIEDGCSEWRPVMTRESSTVKAPPPRSHSPDGRWFSFRSLLKRIIGLEPEDRSLSGEQFDQVLIKQQNLITPVLTMGQCAGRGGLPVSSTSGKDTGPGSVITELLASWDDFQLLQLTNFYRDRLEQAMEGRVHGVSLALKAEKQFSREEHRKISDLADKGEQADSSKLLLSLVMEKGSRARRVMWETFVKMWNDVAMWDKILNEIQIYGCDPSHRSNPAQGLIKVLSELK